MQNKAATAAVAAGCQTYPPTTFQVCGRIRDKYNQTGGPTGFLLFPKSNELTNPGNTGKRSEFLGGNIYWSAATDAHPVAHDFLTEWGNNGYETGFLKYPTTDEIVLAQGRRQEFQGGGIFWSPASGAHTLYGTIRTKWQQLGGETGYLGYPITNEAPAPDWMKPAGDRFQFFQGGALIWKASNNTAVPGGWSDYLPPGQPTDEDLGPASAPAGAGNVIPAADMRITTDGGVRPAKPTIIPAAQESCPAAAKHPEEDLKIYDCVTQFVDVQGNKNLLRHGKPHNAAGKGGFGEEHYKEDHSVETRGVELLLQDDAPEQLNGGTRRRYAESFNVAGNKLIAFQVISNWAPLTNGPDSEQFGIITAYCSLPQEGDKKLQDCPDIMPPFNLKAGE